MKRVGGVGRSGAGAVLLARRAESLQQPHGRRRSREAGGSMRWGVVKALLRRCNGFAAHSGINKIEDRDEGRSLAAAEFQYEHSNSSKIKAGRAKHVKKQTQTHTRSG